MLNHWGARSLDELLAEHGLAGVPEEPFPNDGWSGARLTLLRRGDERFVLKRTSWRYDWIARATRDHALREGFVAANALLSDGPVVAPYLGAAADGTTLALLMRDLSAELIPWERRADEGGVDVAALERIVPAMARLHAGSWAPDPSAHDFPWCPLDLRVLLLTRRSAELFREEGLPVGDRFLAGWDAFDRLAPPAASDLVHGLGHEPAPLLAALRGLPAAGLHGDLKLANVALLDGDRIGLIDWQLMTHAPVAVELGWFLVSNAPVLPESPDRILERYAAAAPDPRVLGDPAAQADLARLVGLLLRGWRKGLDAEAGATLASGVSARDDLAEWCSAALEAARRRL